MLLESSVLLKSWDAFTLLVRIMLWLIVESSAWLPTMVLLATCERCIPELLMFDPVTCESLIDEFELDPPITVDEEMLLLLV